jgi:GT2 family glycosyltransferase
MRFSVVIPTMRREAILEATLESLQHCDPKPAEVIVIDADAEGSSEPVVTAFDQQVAPAVRYLQSQPSLTRQRNMGMLPGGGREGTFTRYGYPRYLRDLDSPRDVEFMQGCFMSARREAAAAVRFDEHMGGYALAEDEDFSYRLSQLGRIRYLPEIIVRHRKLGFGAADERRFGRLVVVNRAYLFRKNFRRTPLARAQFAMLVAMLVGHRLVNREWRGAQGLVEGAYQVLRGRS